MMTMVKFPQLILFLGSLLTFSWFTDADADKDKNSDKDADKDNDEDKDVSKEEKGNKKSKGDKNPFKFPGFDTFPQFPFLKT